MCRQGCKKCTETFQTFWKMETFKDFLKLLESVWIFSILFGGLCFFRNWLLYFRLKPWSLMLSARGLWLAAVAVFCTVQWWGSGQQQFIQITTETWTQAPTHSQRLVFILRTFTAESALTQDSKILNKIAQSIIYIYIYLCIYCMDWLIIMSERQTEDERYVMIVLQHQCFTSSLCLCSL